MSSSSEESYNESDIWVVKKPKKEITIQRDGTCILNESKCQGGKSGLSGENIIGYQTNSEKYHILKERDEELRNQTERREAKLRIWKEKKERRKQLRKDKRKNGSLVNGDTLSSEKAKEEWQEVKPHLTVNDHIHGSIDHGKYGPKTELEIMIDEALNEGDFAKAEQLSDHLADRKFAVKIVNAFEAKRYLDNKIKEDAANKAKKRKKLYWGFEVKQKWQMKANM